MKEVREKMLEAVVSYLNKLSSSQCIAILSPKLLYKGSQTSRVTLI